MTPEQIRQLVREELVKLIPDLFGKSLLQIKEFFGININ